MPHGNSRLDFVDISLDTGKLNVKDPRDNLYGILAMTEDSSKLISIEQWTVERQHEVFLPIEYEADLTSILCATTWVMVMKGGLSIIDTFKAFRRTAHSDTEPILSSQTLEKIIPTGPVSTVGYVFRTRV